MCSPQVPAMCAHTCGDDLHSMKHPYAPAPGTHCSHGSDYQNLTKVLHTHTDTPSNHVKNINSKCKLGQEH